MLPFLMAGGSLCAYIARLSYNHLNFIRQRNKINCRVHVNGIRGKSTITRYVSAVFREAGYYTFGKTTGSAARILRPNGQDYDFQRKGYPNINEQVKIIEEFARQKAEVAVLECMAVNPVYAKWLEEKVMQSHIGIITNVRYDHPDYMGETLEEIAESLSVTIPKNGIFITAEYNPKLLGILWKNAKKKGTKLIVADKKQVNLQDLKGFSHFAIEDNVAIGLEVAKLLGLPKERALRAMQMAASDIGAFRVKQYQWLNKSLAWANLFAVNDRESFVELSQKLFAQYPNCAKVVLLNNRHDRPTRVELFARLAQKLNFDKVVTLGDYEEEVKQTFAQEPDKVLSLGNSTEFKDESGQGLLDKITGAVKSQEILLIGTVNIHTQQAERLLHLFAELEEFRELPQKKELPHKELCLAA
ncbi:MAG: poly-gamma-glutamate synthase PgsB [Prochloraceae cyanobacterium]